MYKTPKSFLPRFESTGLSVNEEKRKIDSQDGRRRPSWISNWNNFNNFDLQVTRCFLPSFQSIGLSVQEKKRKIDFQDGLLDGHLGFPIGTILVIFYLQVTPTLPTKFRVNWPFASGEEAKIDFQDGCHGGHLGFLIGTILAIFWSTNHPDDSYCFKSTGLSV